MAASKQRTPKPGDVIFFTLEDGHYGAMRVIRETTKKEEKSFGKCLLIVLTPWIGDTPPDLNNPELTESLFLKHGDGYYDGGIDCSYTFVQPRLPKNFEILGQVAISEKEAGIAPKTFTTCEATADQRYLQWLWENDKQRYEEILEEDDDGW